MEIAGNYAKETIISMDNCLTLVNQIETIIVVVRYAWIRLIENWHAI